MARTKRIKIRGISWTAYVRVISSERILVSAVTLGSLVLVGGLSLLLPNIYRASALVEIGGINYGKDAVVMDTPSQLVTKVTEGVYDSHVSEKLGISGEAVPNLKAISLVDLGGSYRNPLIELRVDSQDASLADRVLGALIEEIVADHDIELEPRRALIADGIERYQGRIKSLESEKKLLESEITILKGVLTREDSLTAQLALTHATRELEITKRDIEDSYSRIDTMKNSWEDIVSTRLVKNVSAEGNQIGPNLGLNLTVALLLGMFLGILIAFAKVWWKANFR